MSHALLADVQMTSEAAVLVVALVGGLWAWSLKVWTERVSDLTRTVEGYRAENSSLRHQNDELYQALLTAQEKLAECRRNHPRDNPGPCAGGTGG